MKKFNVKIYHVNYMECQGSSHSLTRGNKFKFSNSNTAPVYQVIRIMENGKMGDWALLDLKTHTIGFTDKRLSTVIETYYCCS